MSCIVVDASHVEGKAESVALKKAIADCRTALVGPASVSGKRDVDVAIKKVAMAWKEYLTTIPAAADMRSYVAAVHQCVWNVSPVYSKLVGKPDAEGQFLTTFAAGCSSYDPPGKEAYEEFYGKEPQVFDEEMGSDFEPSDIYGDDDKHVEPSDADAPSEPEDRKSVTTPRGKVASPILRGDVAKFLNGSVAVVDQPVNKTTAVSVRPVKACNLPGSEEQQKLKDQAVIQRDLMRNVTFYKLRAAQLEREKILSQKPVSETEKIASKKVLKRKSKKLRRNTLRAQKYRDKVNAKKVVQKSVDADEKTFQLLAALPSLAEAKSAGLQYPVLGNN